MLGGADNPNGELLSYIIGADTSVITVMTVWRRWTITQRKERFVQSVSERKITCSSVAITAASVEHCCTG